jgi:hypothetical protein
VKLESPVFLPIPTKFTFTVVHGSPGKHAPPETTGADAVGKKHVDSTDIRRKKQAAEAQFHDEKVGLGSHASHEGSIKLKEVWTAKTAVSAEARQKMIAEAAYYLAEKRGFTGNEAYDDWMRAEAEIDAMLLSRIGKSHS